MQIFFHEAVSQHQGNTSPYSNTSNTVTLCHIVTLVTQKQGNTLPYGKICNTVLG